WPSFSPAPLFAERLSAGLQQRAAALVVLGAGHEGDVHAQYLADFFKVDLKENDLFLDSEGVVAPAIEAATRNTAEVTNTRERDRDQAFEEFPHAVTMQGDLHADGHFLPHLEVRDRVFGARDHCLLTRNGRKVCSGLLNESLVSRSCAHTHVEHDLLETRHL